MAQKAYSLSHTKWMCKYHVVFTPKYRRKVIYNQIRSDLGEIFRKPLIINFIRTPPTFIRTCADECGNPIP